MKKTNSKKSSLQEFIETIVKSVLLAAFIMIFIAQSFVVRGSSMEPTLENGQRLVVDKISYRFIDPAPGEVIVFKYPANPQEEFIKRIIAVPGDEVAIVQGNVIVNGEVVEEEYIAAAPRQGFSRQTVPEGHFFVLGDNRNNSLDSRDSRVGFVPRDLIVGRAIWRYWPLGSMALFFEANRI